MSVGCSKTRAFFGEGTPEQFEFVLGLYDQCLRLKAETSKKPENVIKLDKWYQNELPKKIKARGKEAHLIHEDLVQTIKWKLARGKFRPNLVNLIQMNTPRVVLTETKKAFRNIFKKEDLNAGMSALCNLKGVGPAMASAILAAGAPHMAPFMADECLLALPEAEGLDYTMKEYNRLVEHVNACVTRLNAIQPDTWTPHKVELTVWAYYIANDLKPELLSQMPNADGSSAAANTAVPASSSASSSSPNKTENNTSSPEEGNSEDVKKIDESSVESSITNASEVSTDNGGAGAELIGEESNLSSAANDGMSSTPVEEAVPSESDENSKDVAAAAPVVENGKTEEEKVATEAKENGVEKHISNGNGNGNGNGATEAEEEKKNGTSSPPAGVKRPASAEEKDEEEKPSTNGKATEEDETEEPATKKVKPTEASNSEDPSAPSAPSQLHNQQTVTAV